MLKLTKLERNEMESFFSELLKRYEILSKLKAGWNPTVKHIAFTLEPVPFVHRPLILYIAVGIFEGISNTLLLRARGFQHMSMYGLTYWFRQGGTEIMPLIVLVLNILFNFAL